MSTLALTELLGAPVFDTAGTRCGRVRELAMIPQEDRARVAMLIVRTKSGDRMLPSSSITSIEASVRSDVSCSQWATSDGSEGWLLLGRDLLDQQVIDVFGRKVVRVNDVDLHQELVQNRPVLKVGSVDVGPRGAIRRLLKGVVPAVALNALLKKIPPREIPWDFVDLIETDPARRVKLKISHERLAKLHPADIADIVEELAPDEREAVFETLDEQVAAEALEEVHPKVQKAIVESLDSERAADIVDSLGTLIGAVPLARLVLSEPNTPLLALTQEPLISTRAGASEREVAELFDKYNLVTLPVVDENKKLTGVITSDDVISLLRAKL